jgi:hypothetical protein
VAVFSWRRWAGPVAIGLSAVLMYHRFAGHGPALFAEVDWIRARGMEFWPGLINAVGMLFLASAWAARGWHRRLSQVGALLVVAYWVFPQHFMVERLSSPVAGADTIPVVIDGVYDHRQWDRQGEPGVPLLALGTVFANESRLNAMAHGIAHGAGLKNPSGLEDHALRTHSRVRATLWSVQRVTVPLMLLGGVLAAFLALIGGVQATRGRPMPRQRLAGCVVVCVLLLPPVVNLSLRGAGLIFGLPEAADPMSAVTGAVQTMVAVGLAVWGGRAWGSAGAGEE